MFPRSAIFTSEHDLFRDQVRRFMQTEIAPHADRWEEQGFVDRSAWKRAGELGFLCATMPSEYGGADADRLYSAILMEELAYVNASGPGFSLHSDIVAPYIANYGTEDQKRKYLPKMAAGEMIGAIAMTEPGTGSDLQGVKTTAVLKGDHYVLNGSKIFITNGYNSDIVVVVTKTGDPKGGANQMSLLLVEAGMKGFTKGKPLKKVGMKAQDTAELFFDNVEVPVENLLGREGEGFKMLMTELAWERLQIAITAVSHSEYVYGETVKYVKERSAFGKPIAAFQNTRFKLAELKTQIGVGRVLIDRCMELELERKLSIEQAAAAKLWASELQGRVCDECVQLHGGYGYMWEYPVARAWADARVQRIYGGTSEIMKEIISRTI